MILAMNEKAIGYIGSSFLVGGIACLVMVLGKLFGNPFLFGSLYIPGFRFTVGLCFPILFAWTGMLLRSLSDPKVPVKIFIGLAGALCFFLYGSLFEGYSYWWKQGPLLYIMSLCAGYLVNSDSEVGNSGGKNKGWYTLSLGLLSVFCFSAVTLAVQRLDRDAMLPQYEDMRLLLLEVLKYSEAAIVILTVHFIREFSFSELARTIGGNKVFRWIAAFAIVASFAWELFDMIDWGRHFLMNSLQILAQPFTWYLIYVAVRYRSIQSGNDGSEKKVSPWKEPFLLK